MRGINFTADHWLGMKQAIRDTILTQCGYEAILSQYTFNGDFLQQVLDNSEPTTSVDKHFVAIELLLRFVVTHMKRGYLRCAVADNHD